MTLFTAAGLLTCDVNAGKGVPPGQRNYVASIADACRDWLQTQRQHGVPYDERKHSWLRDVDDLYYRCAPGRTCLTSIIARGLLRGEDLRKLLKTTDTERDEFKRLPLLASLTRDQINSSGYVVDTLEAALWSILHTRNYRNCILRAANLGGDTDTTCAVAGGLAGILYGTGGTKGIPENWIAKLARIGWITVLCNYFDKRIYDSAIE